METIAIGDACDILNGYAFKSEKYVSTGIRIIRIANVQKGYIEDNSPVFYPSNSIGLDKYMLRENDLLLSLTGNVGRTALLRKEMLPAALNQRVACLRLKTNLLTDRYLFHLLNSDYFESKCIQSSKGVAQKNLSTEWLKSYRIPLYSISKQEEITKVLDQVRKIIDSHKEQLQKYDELIKSRFVEIFGELSSNPYGWETFTMGECFDITSSKRILKSEWRAQGIPFLRVRDIVQLATTGQMENEYFVSEEFYKSLSDYDGVPQRGDILVSATSTLGKCHVVGEEERYYFKDADVLRFRAKKKINPIFFVELMKEHYIEEQISKTLGITTVAHFTIKAAKNINMRCPDIELQNEFANFVAQVDKSKLTLCRYNINVNK